MTRLPLQAGGLPLAGRRVLVWGFGREGRAVLQLLRRLEPALCPTLLCHPTEQAAAQAFDPRLQVVTDPPQAEWLAGFEVIIKSPGISAYTPALLAAQAQGSVLSSGTALWFARHPQAKVVAVTGTKGKSSTSAMLAHLARRLGLRTVLAGNIGLPVVELDTVEAELWVLELSSFQTGEAGPVDLGVIVNVYEEHLDWHGSRQRYVEDKLKLAAVSRQLLLPAAFPALCQRYAEHPGLSLFGTPEGWHVRDGAIWRGTRQVLAAGVLPLPGAHNLLNACAALQALESMGYDAIAAAPGLSSFRALPHRLQHLGLSDGRNWINDSISTTPEATLVALQSLPQTRVCVIVGGYERGLDWSHFVEAVCQSPPLAIICQGGNGARIAAALQAGGYPGQLLCGADLEQAVAQARRLTAPGDSILLSPGAPSFDQFADYAARGRHFSVLAGLAPAAALQIEGLGLA